MKTSDCDILILPGLGGSGPDHWQTRWQDRLSTARRVEQENWNAPDRASWTATLIDAVATCRQPVVIVAHSLGVLTVVHGVPRLPTDVVKGAMLVSPPDVERPKIEPPALRDFAPIPREPLPFPSLLVASRDDPYGSFEKAEDLSYAWGAAFLDAGSAGHVNAESGYGPWPEGLMRFAGFLKRL